MKRMIPKSHLDEFSRYIEAEGGRIGIHKHILNEIALETAAHFRFTFLGRTSQLELIRRTTIKVVSSLTGMNGDDLENIGLAIDEACTNVIRHSYGNNKNGTIQIGIIIDDDRITFTVEDKGEEGQGFDPDKISIPDRREYLERMEKGGLGLYLIRKIMDEVRYTISPGVSNCLTMTKYLTPHATHGSAVNGTTYNPKG